MSRTAAGILYVVATPIGNLADITLRALDTLRAADCIAAEDTRHTRKLLTHYDIHKPLVSYHSHNMEQRGPELVARMQTGENLALVTDAGTPGISDPGRLLVQQVLEAGLEVTAIPGANAAITALVVSGLPTHPFAFLGFPPSQGTGRRRFFTTHANLAMTSILYESPRRLHRTLTDILKYWGDREIAVARELTKKFEEIFRGTVSQASAGLGDGVKGELTLVVAAGEVACQQQQNEGDWHGELVRLLAADEVTVKEAVQHVANQFRIPRRAVYQEALRMKNRSEEA